MMRHILIITACLGLSVAAGLVMAQTTSIGGMAGFKPDMTQAAQRDCLFPAGGWTIVNPDTATAAASSTLTANTRYIVQCRSDSYISFGGTTADSSDGYLPAGTMLPFMTSDAVTSYSVLNVSSDTDCRHIECR